MSQARRSEIDSYGFDGPVLSRDQQRQQDACDLKEQKLAAEWQRHALRGKLPRPGKLKQLIRQGVPRDLRRWVWMETSGAAQLRAGSVKGYFERHAKSAQHSDQSKEARRQIALDLPRTFPHHAWLKTEEGQLKLGRVLYAYCMHNTTVGYCQGLNCVAGFLLIVTESDEDAFWLLVALVEKILYADTYASNLTGCHVEMRTLGSLVQSKMPLFSDHLARVSCDISMFATDWFLCLFCTSCPSDVAARIWDALFSEGPKVLFRVSMALLLKCEAECLKFDNAGEIMQAVKQATLTIHDREELMKAAFNDVRKFPMAKIEEIRQQQYSAVMAMLAEREAIRARREERERQQQLRADKERQRREEAEREMDSGIDDLTDAERLALELRVGLKKELINVGQGLRQVVNSVHGILKEVPGRMQVTYQQAVGSVQDRAGTSNH
ncbi:MAG: hypothetical protein WDW36_007139 [Sanguina aurantia]